MKGIFLSKNSISNRDDPQMTDMQSSFSLMSCGQAAQLPMAQNQTKQFFGQDDGGMNTSPDQLDLG